MRITTENMQKVLYELFRKYKFSQEKAILLANVFTESTLDGVSSHGINRVPLFIEYVQKGIINIDASNCPLDVLQCSHFPIFNL